MTFVQNYSKMGGKHSQLSPANKTFLNEWVKVGEENGADIVKSNQGFGEGEVRVVSLDQKKTIQNEILIYNYRKNQTQSLVSCYGIQIMKKQPFSICGTQQQIKVLTERIPTRWSSMPNISFLSSLYALKECLKGFSALFIRLGSFDVNSNMVGVNNQNQVKVWVNENFALNSPSMEKAFVGVNSFERCSSSFNNEKAMIQNILSVIESKCERGKFPPEFKQNINSSINFIDCQQKLCVYIEKKKLNPPQQISQCLYTESFLQLQKQPSNSPSVSRKPELDMISSIHKRKSPEKTKNSFEISEEIQKGRRFVNLRPEKKSFEGHLGLCSTNQSFCENSIYTSKVEKKACLETKHPRMSRINFNYNSSQRGSYYSLQKK